MAFRTLIMRSITLTPATRCCQRTQVSVLEALEMSGGISS
jgi:hypothetical protein